jgi:hypothetical protein
MAGSLIKIDEEIVTSAVASVTLGGADWDSSYDVYMVRVNNCIPATDNVSAYMRITKSGTADTTSNYDYAYKDLKAYTTFSNNSSTNQDKLNFGNTGTGGSEGLNTIIYLFNFNSSSEYSFGTQEDTMLTSGQQHRGQQGGFVHTVASASDGVHFFFSSGNIASGTFTLYGLKK